MKRFILNVIWLFWQCRPLVVTGHLRTVHNQFNAGDNEQERLSNKDSFRHRQLAGKSAQDLSAAFEIAKSKYIEKLQTDYGSDLYYQVFEDVNIVYSNNQTKTISGKGSIGRHAFVQTNNAQISWERFRRKIMKRILQYQVSGKPTPFVWATAGDQVAAGRGNFFDQQYTIVLQKAVESVMAAAGIELKTRPYGMGSLKSAPEIAACCKAIFGEDVDLISWDFSEADARQIWRLEFFAHRIMRMDHHPALLVLQTEEDRRPLVEHLTELGMAVLRMDRPYVVDHLLRFPDSELSDTTKMTDYVRYFRCGQFIEGKPECSKYKFLHNGTCDDRPFQTRWHPGWKWQAFHGNLYALFLMEVVGDALEALTQRQGEDPEVILQELRDLEDAEFESFEASENFMYGKHWAAAFQNTDISAHQLADSPTYCHTARLPAQARIMGYVTDIPFEDDLGDFDRGIALKDGLSFQSHDMLLTFDDELHKEKCPAIIHIDYKDFFLATSGYEGYQNLLVPNDSEMIAFGDFEPLGILMVCGAGCTHGCPSQSLDLSAFTEGMASVKVNGEQVYRVESYEDCYLLMKESGDLQWEADENGQYLISVNVQAKGKYMRIGSVVVW